MPAPVAFVFAMPMELVPLTRALSLHEESVDGGSTWVGHLGRRPVVAIVTGMGTQLATAGVERLLAHTHVARVVVVGITGAIHDETPIGTLIRPGGGGRRGHRDGIPPRIRSGRRRRTAPCGRPTR